MNQIEIVLTTGGRVPLEFKYNEFEMGIGEEISGLKRSLPGAKLRSKKKTAPPGSAGIPPEVHWIVTWVAQHPDEALSILLNSIEFIKALNNTWRYFCRKFKKPLSLQVIVGNQVVQIPATAQNLKDLQKELEKMGAGGEEAK